MTVHSDQTEHQRAIRHTKAEQSRALPAAEKLLAGARLFDQTRERIKAGIRARHADWTAEQVHEEFLTQLAKQRAQAEKGIYRVVGYLNDDGSMTPVESTAEHA